MDPIEELAVRRHLDRFANTFDTKQWDEMLECLAPTLHTDYSDLRGTPAETVSHTRFVELRREALDKLATQHLFANHEIDLAGDAASARVSAAIFRRTPEGKTFHTHCLYFFKLVKVSRQWKINSIVQKVYWSEGASLIHAGAASGN